MSRLRGRLVRVMLRPDDVAPVDRFVRLCGTCNARDLGGLPLATGGTTRRGLVFRADAPLAATSDDRDVLAQLRVSTILDLREPHEVVREPNALQGHDGMTVHHVDIWHGVRAAPEPLADPWDLGALYEAALDLSAPAFASAIDHLGAAEGAALFHCTVGKDRTGLLAALVLETVGVPRQAIIEDYALTHDRIDSIRARLLAQSEARGIRREDYVRVLGATPDVITRALEHLERRHGGAERYLLASGVAPAILGRLRERLAG
jgi:protein-tyrosine phosphatase